MTPLGRLIAERIRAGGPISVADYMADCLAHPQHGYYITRDPLGAGGDFTTAPEISQMFGELLGLWLAQVWLDQGAPAPFLLAELGAGRGTLMADMLRAMAAVPGLREAARLHLVETSPALRACQRDRLAGFRVSWHDRIADLPPGPLFLVANEFFDALPIRQFVRQSSGWAERRVGLRDGALTLGLVPGADAGPGRLRGGEGDLVEVCPALPAIAAEIAGRIAGQGGAALIVDYGGWDGTGDTLQAVRAHRPVDPFAEPGAADLTAHVDFAALARAFRGAGATVTGMTAQGVFLQRLGIDLRAERLAQALTGAALDSHRAAHRRLTDPTEMGELFKVIACYPAGAPLPPGLDMPDADDA